MLWLKKKQRQRCSVSRGVKALSAEEIKAADDFCEGYKAFLNASPVEREAVAYTVAAAEKAGFVPFDAETAYKAGDKVYYVNRGKAVALAVIGKNGVKNGARLAIAHIDSPRIDLKPNPLYEASNLALFKTHYYGGMKKYQWTAIPLTLHGVVVKLDGTRVEVKWGDEENESCFCVTDLLPHLAQEQVTKPMAKAFTGEDLNVLVGSRPYPEAEDEKELVKLNVMAILNEKYGITESDFLSAELCLVPSFKAKDIGFDRSMIGGYGHDDKVCAYPALMAALDADEVEQTCITYLTDKEERSAATAIPACRAISCATSSMTSPSSTAWRVIAPFHRAPACQPTSTRRSTRPMLPRLRRRTAATSTAAW